MYRAKSALPVIYALGCAILIGCGSGGGGGLRDPGLSNVQVEVGNSRSAKIGPGGGTITATGSNGVVYKLVVPPEAVFQDTEIALYPIAALKNLPTGGKISAGVNFAPNGLKLLAPATLTIQLPPGIDPKTVFAASYVGNADKLHLDLGTAAGQTITLPIHHFSGTVLGNRTIASLLSALSFAQDAISFQNQMASALINLPNSSTPLQAQYLTILRNWYNSVVKPALISAGRPNTDILDTATGVDEYQAWLDGILYAKLTLNDPSFDVQPENSESEPLAVAVLKARFKALNDICVENKNEDIRGVPLGNSPLWDAEQAMWVGDIADRWHIPRAANGLDKENLLNNLCVKVVIESKTFDGTSPFVTGHLKVKAGFTIDGGAVRHDFPIAFKISGNGLPNPPDSTITSGGQFAGDVIWPIGVNPLKIDILATLTTAPFLGANLLKDIAVFDRITKSEGQGSLRINPSPVILKAGKTITVTAQALDAQGNAMNVDPSRWQWSISPARIASLTANGGTATIQGLLAGPATVTVKLSGTALTGTDTVQVSNAGVFAGTYVGQAVDSQGLNPTIYPVKIVVTQQGNSVTLTVTITDGHHPDSVVFSGTIDLSSQTQFEFPPFFGVNGTPQGESAFFDLNTQGGVPVAMDFQLLNTVFGQFLRGGGTKQ